MEKAACRPLEAGLAERASRVTPETQFRLRLAEGFLTEARQDFLSQRWRSCVDNSQLAVENAAKAALALLGPVGRTHNPALPLRQALENKLFPPSASQLVAQLAECAELLGPDFHVQSDYGDEIAWRTPWELFDESDARKALSLAEDAAKVLQQISQEI